MLAIGSLYCEATTAATVGVILLQLLPLLRAIYCPLPTANQVLPKTGHQLAIAGPSPPTCLNITMIQSLDQPLLLLLLLPQLGLPPVPAAIYCS